MIFLLLSSTLCSIICATFGLIKNKDAVQDSTKYKKQLELSATKTVLINGAFYTQQIWKPLVRFGKFVAQSELLLLRTNLIKIYMYNLTTMSAENLVSVKKLYAGCVALTKK